MKRPGPAIPAVIQLTGLLFCLAFAGFFQIRYQQPLTLAGDNLITIDDAKSFIDGHGFRFNSNVGFPGIRDSVYFPSFDFTYRLFLFLCGQFVSNPLVSYCALYLAGVSAMFLATSFALRQLGVRDWLSVVGAITYVVSPYLTARAFAHDYLALYFSVPLGAALALTIAMRPSPVELRRLFKRPFMWVVIAVVGTSGLYYGFFTCMFLCVLGLIAALARRIWTPFLLAFAVSFAIFAVLVVSGYGFGLADVLNGKIPQVTRFAWEQLRYGLHLENAINVIPGFHYASSEDGEGLLEWPGIALTLVIFTSPLILALTMAGFVKAESKWARLAFLSAAAILFGGLYAISGGLGFYFNALVSPNIRATARIMPFLAFFALVIVLAAAEASLQARRGLGTAVASLLCFGLILCMGPSIGALAVKQELYLRDPAHEADVAGIRALLAVLHQDDIHAVLQLPHVAWPEGGPTRAFPQYGHELPYLLDRPASDIKWSFGATKSQFSFVAVNALLASHPLEGLVRAVAPVGFDAILVEKQAYDADELASLRANIEAVLRPDCRVFDDRFRILYRLGGLPDGTACQIPESGKPALDSFSANFAERSAHAFLLGNWFVTEPWGTWAGSKKANVVLPLADFDLSGACSLLKVGVRPALGPGQPGYSVHAEAGAAEASIALTQEHPEQEAVLVLDNEQWRGRLWLELELTTARAPIRASQLGNEQDPRSVSFGIRAVSLEHGC